VPDSVARFGRFGIGLGDRVSSSLGSQLRVVVAPVKERVSKCVFLRMASEISEVMIKEFIGWENLDVKND
jgi:hypothetical protein